jgi:hypothetical protein
MSKRNGTAATVNRPTAKAAKEVEPAQAWHFIPGDADVHGNQCVLKIRRNPVKLGKPLAEALPIAAKRLGEFSESEIVAKVTHARAEVDRIEHEKAGTCERLKACESEYQTAVENGDAESATKSAGQLAKLRDDLASLDGQKTVASDILGAVYAKALAAFKQAERSVRDEAFSGSTEAIKDMVAQIPKLIGPLLDRILEAKQAQQLSMAMTFPLPEKILGPTPKATAKVEKETASESMSHFQEPRI